MRNSKCSFDTSGINTDDRPLRPPAGGSTIEYMASNQNRRRIVINAIKRNRPVTV